MQEQAGYLTTRNEVFNEIANLRWGSSFLILDETHFESMLFLNALLKDAIPPKRVYVTSFQSIDTPFEVRQLALEEYTSLNDVSITINQLRDYIGSQGIIVHHYLPHILVREDEESALRMLEFWSTKTAEKHLIEFYTLPQGTFPLLEKKLASLTDGEIAIKFLKKEEHQFSFTIKKACKPEYHLMEFPFKVEKGKLLIKWNETFIDQLPKEIEAEVKRRIARFRSDMYSLKVIADLKVPQKLSPNEYILLSKIHGKHLDVIQTIFPDMFDSILEMLARWEIQGVIHMEETTPHTPKPKKERFGIRTRIALALPDRIAVKLIGGEAQRIPADVYWGLKQTMDALLNLYIPAKKEPIEALPEMEDFIYEMAGRMTALRRIEAVGEDPRIKFDAGYLRKIVSLTVQVGFGIKPEIREISPNVLEITLADCFICKGIKSDHHVCKYIASALAGACSQSFKRKFVGAETRCKATGGDACVFLLKAL